MKCFGDEHLEGRNICKNWMNTGRMILLLRLYDQQLMKVLLLKAKMNIRYIIYKHVIETLTLKIGLLVGQIWPKPIFAVWILLIN